MFLRIVLTAALFLASDSIDLCEIVSSDYCFYFGQSSCYLKICECEQEKCNADDSCIYSYWCDINGDYIDTDIKIVDFSCGELKQNCLNKTFFNGYCHFYKETGCATDQAIENLGHKKSLSEACKKWGSTCVKKYHRHFTCRQFRKFCHNFSLPPRVGNITEELDDIRKYPHPDEHGQHWERNMISRCRRWQSQCLNHNNTRSCKKVERRCEDFLSNYTIILKEDQSSSEEDEDIVRNILSSTDGKLETSTRPVEVSTGPNYKKNMKSRCRFWRSHCKKHPNSGQCETYFRRCEEFSSNYKEDLANAMGNHTVINE